LKIPRSDPDSQRLFLSLVPKGRNVAVKPMFGNISAFVNGNLFIGLYGSDFLLRLTAQDAERLLKEEGAARFEPMEGRVMKGYVLAPKSWRRDPKLLRSWVGKSLELASGLPPKPKKQHRRTTP
jgi:TfoX/Sxy family transcriptional regulator of competence genes